MVRSVSQRSGFPPDVHVRRFFLDLLESEALVQRGDRVDLQVSQLDRQARGPLLFDYQEVRDALRLDTAQLKKLKEADKKVRAAAGSRTRYWTVEELLKEP